MTIAAEKIVLEKPPFIVFRKHETPAVIGRCLTLSTIVMPDFSKNRLIGGQPCVKRTFAIRPGEKVAKLVKRMHYVSFVGMFRSDLFEGLCVGHAPKKCKICGKWFLTTNARHTKYCGGYAPGDKLHRTCRQIGNLKGREQRELADDHPLKQIYEKRLNTINRYVKRGALDADLAEVMKKLAKDKMLRALGNVAYAKGDYEKEMGQAALKKEAIKRI